MNFTGRNFNEDLFNFAVEEVRTKIISYALGGPRNLVSRAHDSGILFLQQRHTTRQAREAADFGVDALVVQGPEAGGFCAYISSLSLIPQVVDEVGKHIPVIAAGGIANGRGLAAALTLKTQGSILAQGS